MDTGKNKNDATSLGDILCYDSPHGCCFARLYISIYKPFLDEFIRIVFIVGTIRRSETINNIQSCLFNILNLIGREMKMILQAIGIDIPIASSPIKLAIIRKNPSITSLRN